NTQRTYFTDTWELGRSGGWIDRTTTPPGPAVDSHAAAYDHQAREVVIFGGATWVTRPMGGHRTAVDDTSTYAPTFRASITQRGTGCGGIPPLEFVGLPILGSIEFGLRTPLPPQWRLPTVAAFATAPRTPPLQLGPCRLHLASPLLTIVRTTPATSIPLPIPN